MKPTRQSAVLSSAFLLGMCVLAGACGSSRAANEENSSGPSIEFTELPPAGEGSPEKTDPIEGRVTGAKPGQHIELFARSGFWWVQPLAERPFTAIQSDSTWKNSTHPGSSYAALLVDAAYRPPATVETLPIKGGPVLAVATVEGAKLKQPDIRTLQFSGYEWQIREAVNNPGGSRNVYDPANAWTDKNGFLHLRIAGQPKHWTCAEVSLTRSLGYGSYRFVVHDISQLEPAAAFSLSTWDDSGPPREMNIEISRWGEPDSRNAQYVIQPYDVPANTVRFMAPSGTLTYSLHWEPGRASFRTVRESSGGGSAVVAEHIFSSGVPSPGNETIHMNVYVYDNKRNPLEHASEVVIEKFEYLP